MFRRQSDVRKRGHVVSMFTRQPDVTKFDHFLSVFMRQSNVRKRDHSKVYAAFRRRINVFWSNKQQVISAIHLYYEYECDSGRETQIEL